MLAAGLEALDWYGAQCALDGPAVRLVGNGWHRSKRRALATPDSTVTSNPWMPRRWWRR